MYSPDGRYDSETTPVARLVGPALPVARLPLLTLALVAANLLMAFAQFSAAGFRTRGLWFTNDIGNDMVDWALGAKVPSLIAHGEYWRLVMANFLHGDWLHLAFNMLGLLILGRLIETLYGPARMLAIYILSCVAGAAVSYLLTPAVSLGASTGVMGLMGALLAHNLKYRHYFPDRLRWILPFLLLVLMLQFWRDMLTEGIDLWGHVGGLLGGIAMGWLLAGRIAGPAQQERDWLPLPTAVLTAAAFLLYGGYGLLTSLPDQVDLLRAGKTRRPAEQTAYLEQVVARRPYFEEAQLRLADILMQTARTGEAAEIYKRSLDRHPDNQYVRRQLDLVAQDYCFRGMTAFTAAQYQASLAWYRQAMQYAPSEQTRALAYNGYAWTLADKLNRELDEAERYAKMAVKAAPGDPAIADTLAWVYYRQGRHQEALEQQLAAIGMPNAMARPAQGAELYYHLGVIQETLGQKEEARKSYARVLQLGPREQEVRDDTTRRLRRLENVPPPRPEDSTPDPAASRGII